MGNIQRDGKYNLRRIIYIMLEIIQIRILTSSKCFVTGGMLFKKLLFAIFLNQLLFVWLSIAGYSGLLIVRKASR